MCKVSVRVQNLPFKFIVSTSGKGGTLQHFTHLLATKTEVIDRPHVRKLHYLHLKQERNRVHLQFAVQNSILPREMGGKKRKKSCKQNNFSIIRGKQIK